MTREEAIKILKSMSDISTQGEAIDMAIEALQAKTDGDTISRQDALKPFCVAPDGTRIPEVDCDNFPVEFSVNFIKKHLLSLPSADATKKKAELKENGDWDCPDVDCEECEHIRSVKWCSLAIPNYEEKIDETYKMVHEAFFEGFNAAEERYKFLIEYVEELDKKSVEAESDDLIIKGAKGIKDGLYNIKDGKLSKYYAKGGIVQAYEIVPSAEVVDGKWIDRSDGGRIKYPWWESCECNQCGEYSSGAYNFCPHCGAKMYKGGDTE